MHIGNISHKKVDIEDTKVDINDTKIDIKTEKVDIETEKVDIENICKCKISNISAKSLQHILKLYDKYGNTQYFGRSDIIEIINIKPAMASRLINLLLTNQIIKPIQGKGKGKYQFSI